jgi:hypothetical protein
MMISEDGDDKERQFLRFFIPAGSRSSRCYEWDSWGELVANVESDAQLREQLLAVNPTGYPTALALAQDIARVVKSKLAAIAAVSGVNDRR